MGNGKTYILNDEPIMTTRHTVRDILAAHSEYSKFLELMDGSGLFETIHNNKYACGGTNISLFNTYHYTVYVPTNESIEKLQKQGKVCLPGHRSTTKRAHAVPKTRSLLSTS